MAQLHLLPEARVQNVEKDMTVGARKLLVVLVVATGAFLVPVTPEQADVLKTLVAVFVGGNAVEHVAKAWRK